MSPNCALLDTRGAEIMLQPVLDLIRCIVAPPLPTMYPKQSAGTRCISVPGFVFGTGIVRGTGVGRGGASPKA